MRITIKTQSGRELEFSIPGKEYVRFNHDGKSPGTLGKQICYGGGFIGATVSVTNKTEQALRAAAHLWIRQRRKAFGELAHKSGVD